MKSPLEVKHACFMLISCVACSSVLKMVAAYSPETSVDFQPTTRPLSQNIELVINYVIGRDYKRNMSL
jgi:hypothetical protein